MNEVETDNVEKDVNVMPEQTCEKPVLPAKLTELDRMNVELMKSQRREALAVTKAAVAEQEKLELQYQMMVQQIFNKYGLTNKDKIDESGNIIRGENV